MSGTEIDQAQPEEAEKDEEAAADGAGDADDALFIQ